MLKFNADGLKELHFFTENINFPIAIAIYDEWQKTQCSYLLANIQGFSSEQICIWCITHHIEYQILYPLSKLIIFKNPYKFYGYLLMKYRLKRYSLRIAN